LKTSPSFFPKQTTHDGLRDPNGSTLLLYLALYTPLNLWSFGDWSGPQVSPFPPYPPFSLLFWAISCHFPPYEGSILSNRRALSPHRGFSFFARFVVFVGLNLLVGLFVPRFQNSFCNMSFVSRICSVLFASILYPLLRLSL